jgi:hypothetical protein
MATGFNQTGVGFDQTGTSFDGITPPPPPPLTSAFPTIRLEAAFGYDPLDDTAAWTNIASLGMDFTTTTGKAFELDQVQAGTFSANFKNNSRQLDPEYTAGLFFGQLLVGVRIRVRVSYASIDYKIWEGFVDGWPQLAGDTSNTWATVPLTATDAFIFLATNQVTPQFPWIVGDATYGLVDSAIVGGQLGFNVQSCGDRINEILDLFPFPTSMRDIDDGLTFLIRDLSVTPLDTSLSYCQRIEASDTGRFFVNAGVVTFWQRDHWQTTTTQNTSQLTLTDDGTGDAGYSAITTAPADRRYLRNRIERGRQDMTAPISVQDNVSSGKYGLIVDSHTDILSRYPIDMITQCKWLLAKYKDPHTRVSSVTVNPQSSPAVLWPAVLGLTIGDRITVSRKIAGVGSAVSAEYWIEQITHAADAQQNWLTTWSLSPVDTDTY